VPLETIKKAGCLSQQITENAAAPLRDDIIGLIPAGGQAARVSPLPCSKELFPIGFRTGEGCGSLRPKVIAHHLLEKMRQAGIRKAYIVLRSGKWDIPAYFGDGSMVDMHLAYLMLGVPFGVPFTLDQAYPFVRRATIAFGFADILFESKDAFVRLLKKQSVSHADITLGLFPATHSSSKEDRVDLKENGNIAEIVPAPPKSDLPYSWAIAIWKPSFTEFLHDYLSNMTSADSPRFELSAGHAFQAAIQAGLLADGLVVNETPYLDIGTPENLHKAIQRSL
jgi:glucose-1-phosphate thymidylyltransferase